MNTQISFLISAARVEERRHRQAQRQTPSTSPRLTPGALEVAQDTVLRGCDRHNLLILDIWTESVLPLLDAPDWVNLTIATCIRPSHRLRRLALSRRLATTYAQFTPRWDLVFMFHPDLLAMVRQEEEHPVREDIGRMECDLLLRDHRRVEEEDEDEDEEDEPAYVDAVPSGRRFLFSDEATFSDASLRQILPCTWPRIHAPLDLPEDHVSIVENNNTTELWNVVHACIWNAMPLGLLDPTLSSASEFFDHISDSDRMTPVTAFETPLASHLPGTCPWPSRDLSHSSFFAIAVQMVARILACDEDVYGDWEAWVLRWFIQPHMSFSRSNTKLISKAMAEPVGQTQIGLIEEHVEHARELTLRLAYHLSFFDGQGRWRLEDAPLYLNTSKSRWQRALSLWLDSDACYRQFWESPHALQQALTSSKMTQDSASLTAYIPFSTFEMGFGCSNVATFIPPHKRSTFGTRRFCGAGLCHSFLRIPLIANHRTFGGEKSDLIPLEAPLDVKYYDTTEIRIGSKRKRLQIVDVRGQRTPCGTMIAEYFNATQQARFYSVDGQIDAIQTVLDIPKAKRRRTGDDGAYAVV